MLNACPQCQRTFPAEDGNFCPADATRLAPIDTVQVPSDPNDQLLGAVLAERYEIRRVVADGGMGRVYEAREVATQRRVAIKVLHPEVAEDEVNIERFRREASTSGELDHRHIVEVLDFQGLPSAPGRSGAVWYLAMEYLDGEELRALLQRQKTLGLPRVVRMVSQIALALDPAHKRGFVHRDIKPDNIFLVRTHAGDHVKILDFGSVKFTKGQDKGNKLTVMGTTIGSPFYMAPEQAQGSADLDHRADTWAIGTIVYEMTVGRVPFSAPNGPQILFKILGDEPELPSFANDAAPPQLDDFMVHALQKKPPARYQSCGELADALGHAFGLAGDHTSWAYKSEKELAAMLDPATATPAGEARSEGSSAPAATRAPVEHRAPASDDAGGTTDDYVPFRPVPVWIYAAAGAGVFFLAVAAALMLLR